MKDIKKQRFEYLDGMRGVAALLVVIGHFRLYFWNEKINSSVFNFCWSRLNYFFLNGEFCVELFFVLSGFVLMYQLDNKPAFLTKQLYKRAFRIAVPVLFSLCFYLILINYNVLFYYHENTINGNIGYIILQFFSFFMFSNSFVIKINPSLWTIPIELIWSYVLFFLYYITAKIEKIMLKNIVFLICVWIINKYCWGYGYFGVLFGIGSIMALSYNEILKLKNIKYFNFLFILFFLIFAYFVERHWLDYLEIEKFLKMSYICASMSIILTILVSPIQSFFQLKWVLWLGRISFPLYLIHIAVLGSLSTYLFQYSLFKSNFGLIILLIITLIVSFISAHLFAVLIDEPLMKLFDKYYKKIANTTTTNEK